MNQQQDDWPSNYIELFWNLYPRRVAKKDALRALEKVKRSGEVSFAQLMAGVRNYAAACQGKDVQFIKYPAGWLRDGRWDDDAEAISGKPQSVADVFARLGSQESEDIGWVLPQIGRG